MEWDTALAELLLGEPEIRSWLGLEPQRLAGSAHGQVEPFPHGGVDPTPVPPVRTLRPVLAS